MPFLRTLSVSPHTDVSYYLVSPGHRGTMSYPAEAPEVEIAAVRMYGVDVLDLLSSLTYDRFYNACLADLAEEAEEARREAHLSQMEGRLSCR